ncbi:hypothetical protein F0562_005597 [Nyssa sinensis]|uniref:CCHC-type domain-containing protein n=1 Tax=Nyssa sinensis TaxID=561372 RepID=A0A5J5ALZ0_9ASTE|nr:hypothetical protein F0562_005460 [Nyssa sinensis]KAA8530779.1 hypothetical protein F0562_005597 [Nyssa sinensis]
MEVPDFKDEAYGISKSLVDSLVVSKQSSSNMGGPKDKASMAKWGGKENMFFKCGDTGRMAYQCPKRNLLVGMEHEEEPDQQKHEDEKDSFDFGAFNTDVLEEEEMDTSLFFIVRSILTAPKVEKEDWRCTIFQMMVRCGKQAR